jgi:hypothetical protein
MAMLRAARAAAMKASDGDEGDCEGNSGGERATLTRVEGKGRWRGRQERSRRQKEGDGVKDGDAEGGKSDGDSDEGGG